MIYSPNNNEPLVLVEAAADSFLESVGVKLYDDEISINGTLYEGVYGESILAENGIFLYEDGIVLEGEYAEKYRERKEEEENKLYKGFRAEKKNAERRRHDTGTRVMSKQNPNYSKRYSDRKYNQILKADAKRDRKVDDIIERELSRRRGLTINHDTGMYYNAGDKKEYNNLNKNIDSAANALSRNLRKQEKKYAKTTVQHNSTIFSDIEII